MCTRVCARAGAEPRGWGVLPPSEAVAHVHLGKPGAPGGRCSARGREGSLLPAEASVPGPCCLSCLAPVCQDGKTGSPPGGESKPHAFNLSYFSSFGKWVQFYFLKASVRFNTGPWVLKSSSWNWPASFLSRPFLAKLIAFEVEPRVITVRYLLLPGRVSFSFIKFKLLGIHFYR